MQHEFSTEMNSNYQPKNPIEIKIHLMPSDGCLNCKPHIRRSSQPLFFYMKFKTEHLIASHC